MNWRSLPVRFHLDQWLPTKMLMDSRCNRRGSLQCCVQGLGSRKGSYRRSNWQRARGRANLLSPDQRRRQWYPAARNQAAKEAVGRDRWCLGCTVRLVKLSRDQTDVPGVQTTAPWPRFLFLFPALQCQLSSPDQSTCLIPCSCHAWQGLERNLVGADRHIHLSKLKSPFPAVRRERNSELFRLANTVRIISLWTLSFLINLNWVPISGIKKTTQKISSSSEDWESEISRVPRNRTRKKALFHFAKGNIKTFIGTDKLIALSQSSQGIWGWC